MPFVSADPIEQPHGDALMEELTSDLQMWDFIPYWSPEAITRIVIAVSSFFVCLGRSVPCTSREYIVHCRSQPYIVVQPADSIVRAAGTTFRMRGMAGKRGTESLTACI